MEVLFHFIFQLIKIGILASVYSFILIGILLIVPFTRKVILSRFIKKQDFKRKEKEDYIEGDYEDIGEDNDKKI